jgi:hypothetical protein
MFFENFESIVFQASGINTQVLNFQTFFLGLSQGTSLIACRSPFTFQKTIARHAGEEPSES